MRPPICLIPGSLLRFFLKAWLRVGGPAAGLAAATLALFLLGIARDCAAQDDRQVRTDRGVDSGRVLYASKLLVTESRARGSKKPQRTQIFREEIRRKFGGNYRPESSTTRGDDTLWMRVQNSPLTKISGPSSRPAQPVMNTGGSSCLGTTRDGRQFPRQSSEGIVPVPVLSLSLSLLPLPYHQILV